MKTIAVTGATGFVGSNLTRHLLQAEYSLRILVRKTSRLPDTVTNHPEKTEQLTIVHGGLHDQPALEALVDGVDGLVHCAASVRGNCRQDFMQPNLQGTQNLLKACEETTLKQFIFISSLAARQPQLSWYAESKALAENAVIQSQRESVCLRPPAIYGPGDKEMLPLFQLMARGFAPRITSAAQQLSLLHITDLCTAIERLLNSGSTGQFELHDGTTGGYTWEDICMAMQSHTGRKVLTLPIPAFALRMIARLNHSISRMQSTKAILTLPKTRELLWPDWSCTNHTIQQVIEWQPDYDLRKGLTSLNL